MPRLEINPTKRSTLSLGGLALLSLLLRLPFRSQTLHNWDSVNFALGLLDFNVVKHRPHPPGYILYIELGKVLNSILGDPNISLVWISIVAGVLAVIFTYAFAYRRFDSTDALFSALLVLTNPLLWLYDELALTYSLEAFFSITIAYACWRVINGSVAWIYAGAVLLGLAGGFRQTTLLIMLPLALYAAWKSPWKHRLLSGVLLLLICLAWGLPLIERTGGLVAYLLASRQLSSVVEPQPVTVILHALFYGGHIPLLFAIGLWLGLYALPDGLIRSWEKTFLLLWVLPGLAMVSLRHIGQSGYILFTLPPLIIYAPVIMRAAFRALEARWPVRENQKQISLNAKVASLIIVILLINISAFLVGGLSLIQLQDNRWKQANVIANQYPPESTIVTASLEWDAGFRHAEYYFPGHHVFGFASARLSRPANLNLPEEMILGWLYQSYQLQDNYDLNPDTHLPELVLEFPHGTTGILMTGRAMLLALLFSLDNHTIEPSNITYIDYWIAYVELHNGVNQMRVDNGLFIFESGGK
jgi:hypothetical protein